MSCCAPLPLPAANMLTLSQVSLLVAKAPQDDNNNFGCGVLALKMMSSRYALSARAPPRSSAQPPAAAGPKRCLFGAPSAADTQRLLREDQDAAKARMLRRWGWDLSREAPSTSAASSWKWEGVKPRRHPYAVRPSSPKAAATVVVTPTPAIVSPLPATPTDTLNTSAASSSSGTSTLSSPPSPCLALPSVELCESDDSCCGGSESDSSSTCDASPRAHATPVQTRITDFWRTRRCSTSEPNAKANPGQVSAMGTSVAV